jgi:hypothetical protein
MNTYRGKFKISGYKFAETVENAFSSYLVDVAYIEQVGDDFTVVFPEEAENTSIEYLSWVKKSIVDAIERESGEVVNVDIL